ncbi:FAD-dependent monooxygenase [Halobacterium wangiae]|uniref:FAD binding domain-containing protein n=1 Tax=Halobacterium wangiae TaxID=2902623 RepID=UPI001E4F460F|nr:FAD-dependent monooxygenase [Halobacterium wangiae]
MTDRVYDYDGPPRVCHEGHVYYESDVMQERYDLPDVGQREQTVADVEDRLDVVVSGGSMGGLFAATALRQAGHDVTVYEETERGKMRERGAGIIAHPEMLTYLEEQGIADWDQIATHTNRTHHLDQTGKPVDVEGHATYTTSWDTVYRNLRDDLPEGTYRMGKETTGVEQHADGVTVSFADGEQVEADLLVVAEGYRSPMREQFVPERTPEYSGYVAYRGTLPESAVLPEYPSTFSDVYNLYHAPRSQFLTYPVPGPNGEMEKGERRINWVWYYPFEEGEALDDLLYDNRGTQRSHSLPPGLMREAVREQQIAIAGEILPPQMEWLVRQTAEPFVQCIYDLAIPQLVFDDVCVLGDAAFFIRPHMAAGTAHAAADALELAESIYNADDLDTALAEWERDQVEMGYRLVEEARRRGDRYTGQF